MKQTKLWLITIAALLCSITVSGYDFKVDGIYYNITSFTDLTVEVTYREGYSNVYRGTVTIPSRVTYYKVTSIGVGAFEGCSSLTSITIPESVTSIGNYAFEDCSSLTSITIPEGVTSIGSRAFEGCSSLTSITLPESVTSIGSGAFEGTAWYNNLPNGVVYAGKVLYKYKGEMPENSSVTIKEGTKSIVDLAFEGCSSLTSITIPESVTSIGGSAFSGCSSLTSITIPESVTSIGNYAFKDCSSLTSITIPEGVTSIESSAFSGCSSLTSITIPESVTSIGNYAFEDCSSLTSITIPEGVTSIGHSAFDNCSSLTSITIPEGVTSIGSDAFEDCSSLEHVEIYCSTVYDWFSGYTAIKEIVLGESVTSIGNYAFYNCSSLTSITIPEGVTSIGSRAFEGCSSLTSITIPEGVTSIGQSTFEGCSSLTSITIPESVTSIGSSAFEGTAWYNNLPNGVVYAGKVLYKYKGEMPENTSIEIKEGTVIIRNYAFYNCSSLTSITIPEGVTSIESSAFSGCSSLTSITIPESVTSIGNYAFEDCSSLEHVEIYCSTVDDWFSGNTAIKEIVLGESVTSIGNYAFKDCSSLTSITLPEGVTSIGHSAFDNCSKLYKVINYSKLSISKGSFGYGYVAYYAKLVINGNDLTTVGDFQFYTSSDTHYLVNYIGQESDIVLPDDYNGMSYNIEGNAFYGYTNLQNVTIGNGVKSIGDYAFSDCSGLKGFSFGNNLAFIGVRAFDKCSNLSTITSCSVTPPVCGTQALDDINKQTCTLRVPIGYAAAYQTADQWKEFLFIEDVVEVEKYTLTFMVDGEVYQTFSLPYNAEVTIPDAPTKEGYTFSGWDEVPSTMPAGNVTVSGFFTINKYLVTFIIDDEVIASDSIEYGTDIIVPDAPTKEGYTFSGWDEVPATMPANDVTISGFFTPNMYKVYYYVDEELVHTAEVVYGEAIPKYVYEPMVKGEVFVGWIGETYETMPAHDVTYKAEIDIISINLTIDQYGSGTFCSMHALDFSEVAGLKAYVATGYNTETGVVTLTRVMTAKPGEGLFLKGNPGDYEVATMKDSESCMQNLLVGALEDTIVNSTSEDGFSANYEYIIKGYDTTPVFYGVVDGSVQKGGKAYLQLPKEWIATGMTRAIGLRFDDEEIEFSDEEQPATPAVIHDLQGRRVTTPSNGTFIVNGKKVVFK